MQVGHHLSTDVVNKMLQPSGGRPAPAAPLLPFTRPLWLLIWVINQQAGKQVCAGLPRLYELHMRRHSALLCTSRVG
jgi:hypothetical protein